MYVTSQPLQTSSSNRMASAEKCSDMEIGTPKIRTVPHDIVICLR